MYATPTLDKRIAILYNTFPDSPDAINYELFAQFCELMAKGNPTYLFRKDNEFDDIAKPLYHCENGMIFLPRGYKIQMAKLDLIYIHGQDPEPIEPTDIGKKFYDLLLDTGKLDKNGLLDGFESV